MRFNLLKFLHHEPPSEPPMRGAAFEPDPDLQYAQERNRIRRNRIRDLEEELEIDDLIARRIQGSPHDGNEH